MAPRPAATDQRPPWSGAQARLAAFRRDIRPASGFAAVNGARGATPHAALWRETILAGELLRQAFVDDIVEGARHASAIARASAIAAFAR